MLSEYMRKRYNEIAKNYSSSNERPWVKHYSDYSFYKELDLELIKLSTVNAPKLLELGCGDGRQSRFLKQKYPNIDITASDISDEQINIAKDMSPNMDIKFIRQDAKQMDYKEEFDLIFASYLLCNSEHKQDMLKFLSSIYNALKPGCCFITFDPNVALNPNDVYKGLEEHGLKCVWIPSENNETKEAQDGDKYYCEIWDPKDKNSLSTFYSCYLTKSTYNECFKEIGFTSTWIVPQVNPEELSKDPDFWAPVVNKPSGSIIILRK